jgi:hypothetical protein
LAASVTKQVVLYGQTLIKMLRSNFSVRGCNDIG